MKSNAWPSRALVKDGIPATAFESTAIHGEVQWLKEKGVITMIPEWTGSLRRSLTHSH